MFEITRADDGLIFNPYIKTQCVLKQDGFLLFEGYLRMIDIKDKKIARFKRCLMFCIFIYFKWMITKTNFSINLTKIQLPRVNIFKAIVIKIVITYTE